MDEDTIYRQDAVNAIEWGITYAKVINKETGEVRELFAESNKELRKAVDRVKQLPSAQPERKTGKWIMKYKGSAVTSYKCSECGRTVKDDTGYDVSKDYPFCHCGADMREGQDDSI